MTVPSAPQPTSVTRASPSRACPAALSARRASLPIGLAHRVRLKRDVAQGEILGMADVDLDETQTGVRLRREMLAAALAGR